MCHNKVVKRMSDGLVAFFQATGVVLYCGLIGFVMWNGNAWFGKAPGFLGPLAFLLMFIVSAVLCALIFLGYPFWLFWEKKKTERAIGLMVWETGWLVVYLGLVFGILAYWK